MQIEAGKVALFVRHLSLITIDDYRIRPHSLSSRDTAFLFQNL